MSPLRKKQLTTKLRMLENNYINSIGADSKRTADELNRFRNKVKKLGIKGRSNQQIINDFENTRQEKLKQKRIAGYKSAVDDPNKYDIVDFASDLSDLAMYGAGAGLAIKIAKNPKLILELPKNVQSKVQTAYNKYIKSKSQKSVATNKSKNINQKGPKKMAKSPKKQAAAQIADWVKPYIKGMSGAKRQALINASKKLTSRQAKQLENLKSVLKTDGTIDANKLAQISNRNQMRNKISNLVSKPKSGKGANVAVATLVGAGTGAILADKLDLEMPDFPKGEDPNIKKKRDAEQKTSKSTRTEYGPIGRKTKKSVPSPAEMGGGKSKTGGESKTKPNIGKGDPAAPPAKKDPPKLSKGMKDLSKTEAKAERQRQASDRKKNIDTMDVTGAKEKRERLRGATQLADLEKKVGENKKKSSSKSKSKKPSLTRQGKSTVKGFTIDSTDEGMSKFLGSKEDIKRQEMEEEMNLYRGGMAFGKGGIYKAPKKTYGMRSGGFTRRGASR